MKLNADQFIIDIILGSFRNSLERDREKLLDRELEKKIRNRKRSSRWVSELAKSFRNHYNIIDPNVRVFSIDYDNKKEFGLNELLYDIHICETKILNNKPCIRYITKSIWQVESEFAKDRHQAIIDINKLVCGSAKKKLFIGPQVADNKKFIDRFLPIAKCCSGDFYLSLLPHPDDWFKKQMKIDIWKFNDNWHLINSVDEGVISDY